MSDPIAFDPPKPDELSAMLSGYDVIDLIATGGMGAVYRANQVSLDRPVAIKLLPSELNDPAFREQFQAEARAMAKLNHPNLIGIYDFGQADGMPYIVMELVSGKSLYYSSYGKAIDQTTACEIVIGICRGLAHAHAADIVHRDIKPANILLDSDANPKIGDFGLASASDSDNDGGAVYGTPGYAAPEILASAKAIGIPSDLYAVGVILYQLLTGKMPDEPARPPSALSSCDSRLDPIFRRSTRRNPAMRYQSADDLADDLEKLLPNLGKAARPAMRTGSGSKSGGSATIKRNTKGPAGSAAAKVAKLAESGPGQRKLSTASDSKKTTTPAKVKLTPASERRPELATSDDNKGEEEDAPPITPQIAPIETASNWPIIRNLMIIAVLIPAIIFAWGKYKNKQARLEKERNEQELKDKAAAALREAKFKKEREEAKERARLAEERRKRQAAFTNKGSGSTTDDGNPAPPPKKSPLEQLADLRIKLAGGSRYSYPEGTIDRSTYAIFIVETPMTWSEASKFAEDHGGHLATPLNNADRDVITSRMTGKFERMWIGGGARGKDEWAWVTGAEWTYRNPATTLGSCAALTRTGIIKARPNGEKNPFVIQWSADGSNPGSVTAQLQRLAPTLETPSPAWPPTAVTQDNRVFLIVQKSVSWDEADFIASTGGGHLAVASNPIETSFINDHLNASLSIGSSIWLGGRKNGDLWTWSTGEPWNQATWKTNSPDGGPNDTALRYVKESADSGWDDISPSPGSTDGFLIEWSTDAEHAKASGTTTETTQGDGDIANLRSIGRRVVNKQIEEHKDRLKQNQRTLMIDLNSWLRVQSKSTRNQFAGPITNLEEALDPDGVLPEGLPVANLPPITKKYYTSALERQARFIKQHGDTMENLRQSFLTRLLKLRDEFESSGQKSKIEKIERIDTEISAVGQTVQSFQSYFD